MVLQNACLFSRVPRDNTSLIEDQGLVTWHLFAYRPDRDQGIGLASARTYLPGNFL